MSADSDVRYLMRRVAELEERVASLESGGSGGGGAADPMEPSAYVRELVASESMIEAIHEYRRQTGLDLKEAKRRLEELRG